MRDEIRDAIESARSVSIKTDSSFSHERRRLHSFAAVRALVLGVVRELPDDMCVGELRDELEISASPEGSSSTREGRDLCDWHDPNG